MGDLNLWFENCNFYHFIYLNIHIPLNFKTLPMYDFPSVYSISNSCPSFTLSAKLFSTTDFVLPSSQNTNTYFIVKEICNLLFSTSTLFFIVLQYVIHVIIVCIENHETKGGWKVGNIQVVTEFYEASFRWIRLTNFTHNCIKPGN